MRIVPYDDLPARADAPRAALQLSAFASFLDGRTVRRYRRHRYLLADYVGLFAVDHGEVVGQTYVLRLPYRTRSGLETISGIAGVTTRRDRSRRGIATAILEEVHRRERAHGSRFALLWTNRGWYAHGLYERLGYRDVYVPPIAVKPAVPAARRPAAAAAGVLRPEGFGHLAELERRYAESEEGSYGFAVRPARFLRMLQEGGHLERDALLTYRRRGRRLGYAYATLSGRGQRLTCDELVAPYGELPGVVRALERRVPGGMLVLWYSPVRRLDRDLRRRGYLVRNAGSWYVMMAKSLGEPAGGRALVRELGTDQAAFACMDGDRF